MYRCMGVQIYGGVQIYWAYRHMGDVLGHTDVWGDIQMCRGCPDVQRAYRCMGDIQMYGSV